MRQWFASPYSVIRISKHTSYAILPINWVVNSWKIASRSISVPSTAFSRISIVSFRYFGSATSVKAFRFVLLRKCSPAFLWTFQRSPSALIIPFPSQDWLASYKIHEQLRDWCFSPNKSHDLLLKKSPFANMPSFLNTNSRFFGSLITTPKGNEGTEIWKVSNPNWRSHFTNHEKSLWRAFRKIIPFPTIGRVFGGCLDSERQYSRRVIPRQPLNMVLTARSIIFNHAGESKTINYKEVMTHL